MLTSHAAVIRHLDTMNVRAIFHLLDELKKLSPREVLFASQMYDALQALRAWIDDPIVADAVVVPVSSGSSGEVPMAYIVKSEACKGVDEKELKKQIHSYVNNAFAKYKHLSGGIEFIDAIPKTAIGKTRRSVVKDMARRSVELSKKKVAVNAWRQAPVSVRVIEFDSDDED